MFFFLLPLIAIGGYFSYQKFYAPKPVVATTPLLPSSVPAPATPGVVPATPAAAAQAAAIVQSSQDPSIQTGVNPQIQQPSAQALFIAVQKVKDQAANALLVQGNTPEATAALLAVESLPNL